jgi:hypothetical protein
LPHQLQGLYDQIACIVDGRSRIVEILIADAAAGAQAASNTPRTMITVCNFIKRHMFDFSLVTATDDTSTNGTSGGRPFHFGVGVSVGSGALELDVPVGRGMTDARMGVGVQVGGNVGVGVHVRGNTNWS